MIDIKRILVPVDFSYEARKAVEWAIALLKNTPGAVLFLFHAISPPYADYMAWKHGATDHHWDQERQELDRWTQNIPSTIHSDYIVADGPVAPAVRQTCDTLKIDMIVMITRERHGLSGLFKPNTGERIVRSAPCPILVLHLNQPMKKLQHPVNSQSIPVESVA